MPNLIKVVDLGNRNLMGLRPAQAELYKYLKKCADEETLVEFDSVVDIYFTKVRLPDARICPRCGGDLAGALNKDYKEWMKDRSLNRYKYFIKEPVKMWMQNTMGSLVMRGLLTVIPTLDIQITEICITKENTAQEAPQP